MTTTPDTMGPTSLARRIEDFRLAYESRNMDAMMALFADDAEFVAAPGTFRGKQAVRLFLEWDGRLSPTARIRDVRSGVLVTGRTASWERVISLTYQGIPYEERTMAVVEFDEHGLITSLRSYYDKLDVIDQIASRSTGIRGWIDKKVTGYLVAAGRRGLDPAALGDR